MNLQTLASWAFTRSHSHAGSELPRGQSTQNKRPQALNNNKPKLNNNIPPDYCLVRVIL